MRMCPGGKVELRGGRLQRNGGGGNSRMGLLNQLRKEEAGNALPGRSTSAASKNRTEKDDGSGLPKG